MVKFQMYYIPILLLLTSSCSIKEDRSLCSCRLTIDAEDINHSVFEVKGWSENRIVLDKRIDDNIENHIYEFPVPRGCVNIVSYYGNISMMKSGSILALPCGSQMDSIYVYSSVVNTMCESVFEVITPHKNFSAVYLEFVDSESGMTQYDLEIVGNTNGMDLRTFEPMRGEFRCVPDLAPDKGYVFRIPRQFDDNLLCKLCANGEFVDTIDLGYLIRMTRYDWTEEDLKDIHILVDLSAHKFNITVLDWDEISITVTI